MGGTGYSSVEEYNFFHILRSLGRGAKTIDDLLREKELLQLDRSALQKTLDSYAKEGLIYQHDGIFYSLRKSEIRRLITYLGKLYSPE